MSTMLLSVIEKRFKTRKAFAIEMNVSEACVSQWLHRGLPAHRALQLEEITKGKVKAKDLFNQPTLGGASWDQ